MKRELKHQWVNALRSGKYRQGRRHLCARDNAFCCLGVLADIGLEADWILVPGGFRWQIAGCDQEFDAKTLRRLGLTDEHAVMLITMNDIERNSFHEIADWIESHL